LERLRTDIVFYVGGPSGRGVELLQEDLVYFYLSSGTIDGIYGVGTRQSVRDFQTDNNLFVDGEAGPGTLKKMDELLTTLYIQPGDTGSLVRRIQEQLNEQESSSSSVKVDGIYGSATTKAVKEFQEATEQHTDGIAGPVTMNLLDLEAVHPSNTEDITGFLNQNNINFEITEENQTKVNEFKDALSENQAFQNNLPTGSGILENLSVSRISLTNNNLNKEGEVYRLSGTIQHLSSYIYVFALFQNIQDLNMFGFTIVEGDLYESPAKVFTYDVNGEILRDMESTVLELTNAELDVQKEITKTINETSQNFRTASIDLTSCDALLTISAAVFCGLPGVILSGVTIGISFLVLSGVCSYVTFEYFVDAVC